MLMDKDNNTKLNQDEAEDLLKVLKRIDEETPNDNDVAKVREILMYNSHLWENGHGLSANALNYYIERIEKYKSQRLFIEAEAKNIKEQLGYFSTNQIEKLIIEQILLRWVAITYIENRFLNLLTEEKRVFGQEVYWQKILIRHQNLYLRSLETLARIRKLSKGISFQVNIATNGGQQVNVTENAK